MIGTERFKGKGKGGEEKKYALQKFKEMYGENKKKNQNQNGKWPVRKNKRKGEGGLDDHSRGTSCSN